MHPSTIDWLRQIHLHADTAFATRRTDLAKKLSENITQKEIVVYLRTFLFPPAAQQFAADLTLQFKGKDIEFPGTDNVQDVRLMTGLVMVEEFAKHSYEADAFALGIQSAAFPPKRSKPIQLGIVEESAKYLAKESNRVRPLNFSPSEAQKKLSTDIQAVASAEQGNDLKEASDKLAQTLHETYGIQVQRLAEESGLAWWLLDGFSDTLNKGFEDMSQEEYALVLASEAEKRTQIVPSPPSMRATMARALAACKKGKNKKTTLKNIVDGADPHWRAMLIAKYPAILCFELVPLMAALTKTEESGDTEALTKVLPKVCPGVTFDLAITPLEAANQLFNELMFLRSLAVLT